MTTYHLLQLLFLGLSATYHQWACAQEDRQPTLRPGQLSDINGTQFHWQLQGDDSLGTGITVVVDHSLGGVDGYFLAAQLAPICRVFTYDRAGYGWSQLSPQPRTSEQAVTELAQLLTQAQIPPPYVLLGDSFGTYNIRLFAHHYPDQVVGMVLTDGLHEAEMLTLNLPLRVLKAFLWISFLMAQLGAMLGIIRLLGNLGIFELIKPQLRRATPMARQQAKYSFYRGKHWATMAQEIWHLDCSGQQLQQAGTQDFADLPIASIKAATFLRRNLGTLLFPLGSANRARDRMHKRFAQLSRQVYPSAAPASSHFVWIDQPEVIVQAVQQVLTHCVQPKPKPNVTQG
jgi:pimeloyl-ACP methyl ester carboxylesterase